MSRHTLLGAALGLACGGCSETVVLGTDCPEQLGACAARKIDASDAGATGDAELDAAATADSDAATSDQDGAPPVQILNPSFELQANGAFPDIMDQFGSDVWVSDVGQALPVTDRLFANIQPWFACFLGTKAVSQLQRDNLGASDQSGFVSTSGGLENLLPGLYQRLSSPLQPGQTYSFKIDVQSSKDVAGQVSLELGAKAQPCSSFRASAKSGPLQDGPWQTICLSFTPNEALSVLGIVSRDLGLSGGLAFDNLRSVPSCP